jgi:hypothetical protein
VDIIEPVKQTSYASIRRLSPVAAAENHRDVHATGLARNGILDYQVLLFVHGWVSGYAPALAGSPVQP